MSVAPLPYQREVVAYLKKTEPELWSWGSSAEVRGEFTEEMRTALLKANYRLDSEGHPELVQRCAVVKDRLAITAPVTLYQSAGGLGLNAMLCHLPGEAHIVFTGPILATLKGAELETELRHAQKLVAVAGGKQSGDTGWVVLDGSDSRWYSAGEFPGGERGKTILKIHIGRRLLRLPPHADRKKWLRPPAAIPDEQIIAAYEKLLSGCLSAPLNEQATLFASSGSPLSKHFETYVNAVVRVRHQARAGVIASTYEVILTGATTTTAVTSEKALDSFTPVGERLGDYAAALIELGRGTDALALVRKLLPLWQHNLGYGKLGVIAFKAGDHALAEELLLKLKTSSKDWPRSAEMTQLAEIWQRRGNTDEARDLMLDCLRHTLGEAAEATGSDIQFHERIYQRQREDFGRIFGDVAMLGACGLPDTTLT
jgi:Flp pilus assembly protein TadD